MPAWWADIECPRSKKQLLKTLSVYQCFKFSGQGLSEHRVNECPVLPLNREKFCPRIRNESTCRSISLLGPLFWEQTDNLYYSASVFRSEVDGHTCTLKEDFELEKFLRNLLVSLLRSMDSLARMSEGYKGRPDRSDENNQ